MAAREYLSNPLLADFGVKLGSRNIGVRKDRLDGSEVRAVIDVRIILPTDTRVSICESRGHGPADSVRPDHRDNHGIRNSRGSQLFEGFSRSIERAIPCLLNFLCDDSRRKSIVRQHVQYFLIDERILGAGAVVMSEEPYYAPLRTYVLRWPR